MNAQRQTGIVPQRLADAPKLPKGLSALWGNFLELHNARGSSGLGVNRITFNDIDAWQRVNGYRFERWEREAIRKADDAYLAHSASIKKEAAN